MQRRPPVAHWRLYRCGSFNSVVGLHQVDQLHYLLWRQQAKIPVLLGPLGYIAATDLGARDGVQRGVDRLQLVSEFIPLGFDASWAVA